MGPTGPAGQQGLVGPIGADGIQGPQGIPGPIGPQGVSGVAGTVGTIKASFADVIKLKEAHPTGAPGDFYYIEPDLWVWDVEEDDWINVGEVAGPQGIQGIQGERGEVGATGSTGPQGPQGSQGNPGERGEIGPVGPIGLDGLQGPKGDTGPAGPQGPDSGPSEMYHTNLSAIGSEYDIPLKNINFRLRRETLYLNAFVAPVSQPVYVDVRRASIYLGSVQGEAFDNSLLTKETKIDDGILRESNEMHRTWIRQQNPADGSWSLCEVDLFISKNGARISVWVYWLADNIPDSLFG